MYLIFPQDGVLASHVTALRYLMQKGYAPVVVSNIPLSGSDSDTIRNLSWMFIERPNFGYDFGGYRDGILKVLELSEHLERLVLLNDSAWFPLPGSKDWLDQAEALQKDFVGAASNYGHPRVDPESFQNIQWSYSTEHKNFHYCSYALMFSGRLLKDAAFARFWKRFPLTNNKKVTVRRGEIGLSQWIMSNGYSHGSTLELTDLDRELSELSAGELRDAVEQLVIPEHPRLLILKARLLAKNASAKEYRDFILTAVALQGVSYTLASLMHRRKGFAFLKKSPCWLNEEGSDLTLKFAASLGDDFGPVIVREASAARSRRAPHFKELPEIEI